MDSTTIYEYILSRIGDDLAPYGYKRSGKGRLFYRYFADGKVGCAVEMQKSMFNSREYCSFTFNLSCVSLYELSNYYKDKLTLQPLKISLLNVYSGAERIGDLCRGGDYWWTIDDDMLSEYTIEEYYDFFIHKDIEKAARHLNELADKKGKVYNNKA